MFLCVIGNGRRRRRRCRLLSQYLFGEFRCTLFLHGTYVTVFRVCLYVYSIGLYVYEAKLHSHLVL